MLLISIINNNIMTDFITSFSFVNVNNVDNVDNAVNSDIATIYDPEFTVKRKSNSHTMRKCFSRAPREYIVGITRPKCTDGIPVTEMDEYLSERAFDQYTYRPTVIPLQKKDLYERFIFDIEECCVEKTTTYDKEHSMNKTKYKVPAIGLLVDHDSEHSFSEPHNVDKMDDIQKFIMICGKMYPIYKYFRECGLDYGEIELPEKYFSNLSLCDVDETSYTVSKVDASKDKLTYSFHHDMKISSLVLRPELMKFKKVTADNSASRYDRRNPLLLQKQKYYINVLENDPGFLGKFEMFYRSDSTNGQWVKHGIYNGNVSISDSTKISFDEIVAKEIRIVPLSFHKSVEHIRINFIGKCPVKPKSDEIFVTYEVSIPRDGKYLNFSSKLSESSVKYKEYREWKKDMMENKKRDARRDLHQKMNYDA